MGASNRIFELVLQGLAHSRETRAGRAGEGRRGAVDRDGLNASADELGEFGFEARGLGAGRQPAVAKAFDDFGDLKRALRSVASDAGSASSGWSSGS